MSNQRGSSVFVAESLILVHRTLMIEKEYARGYLIGQLVPAKRREEELVRLRKELADVKKERDILKRQ